MRSIQWHVKLSLVHWQRQLYETVCVFTTQQPHCAALWNSLAAAWRSEARLISLVVKRMPSGIIML